ncbi:MAG TPA: N-acetylmuramoyl-L-alanine amidase-like domain-containing protein [Blastocatellia bacterium]|nr:N-acetylmuramoyl-L-alanine amidase-like domain-containing protein [Blastocatellia bacterium]
MGGRALTARDSAHDSSEVEALLSSVERQARLPDRVEYLSRAFLARPYAVNPLGGGPDLEETLTASLDAFDCVTYIESVLALALARDAGEFRDILKRVRYEDGEVAWHKRNHYMSGWATNNVSAGFVRDVTAGPFAEQVTRRLSVVEGLPPREVSFHLYRKRRLSSVAARIETGDLILFASAKRNLDFFHTGLLVEGGGEIMLRHAARSEGSVIEQPLADFLTRFRMSGFALLRPADYNESKQD